MAAVPGAGRPAGRAGHPGARASPPAGARVGTVEPPPPGPAAPAPPDLRSWTSAATSTPACASSPRAEFDGLILAAAGLHRLGHRSPSTPPRSPWRRWSRPRARAPSPSRPRRGPQAEAAARGDRPRAVAHRVRGGAAVGRPARRRLRAAPRRLRRGPMPRACACSRWSSAPTARTWSWAQVEARHPRRPRPTTRPRTLTDGGAREMLEEPDVSPGFVSLVGAGPGDPGLITVKGLSRLLEADVIVHDRLIDAELLRAARPDALADRRRQGARRQAPDPGADQRGPRRARPGRPPGGAAQGRRPVRVRPGRRGGQRAARGPASRSRSSPG